MWCARMGGGVTDLGCSLRNFGDPHHGSGLPLSPGSAFSLQALMLGFGARRLLTALLQPQPQRWPLQPSRDMRLVQFQAPHLAGPRLGLESGNDRGVIDLNAFDSTLPKTMIEFLEQGEATLSVARRALTASLPTLLRSEVTFLPPVTRPDKVVCVGMNYVDHCKEQKVPVPKEPIIFSKFASSIVGPYDEVVLPPESQEVDWEVELAVIIGKKGKHIKATDAMAHVAGFTVAHDVSARDWQMRRNGKQWLLGKTFDTFCPLGPALVTKDSVPDPHNLKICCRVNGEVVQSSSTSQMVFKTEELIAWVSQGRLPDRDAPRCRCIPETSGLSQEGRRSPV
ncbi:oxaloacetate tautomerase FAHD2A, mitochondrial isoform 2-T2 [Trichechus inunguis]